MLLQSDTCAAQESEFSSVNWLVDAKSVGDPSCFWRQLWQWRQFNVCCKPPCFGLTGKFHQFKGSRSYFQWSSGRFMGSDCSDWGPGEILAVEFFCIRSPEGGHATPVGLMKSRSPNPNAEMKKAIWEEWKALKYIKMPFAASGIDFQSLCWNLQSLCLVSFLRLIYFQHQCHSPFSTCHGMSRHCASMCFTSPHRLIFDLTPNMWYMWYMWYHVIDLSFLCIAHVFWRHHWCIWVWCRPSWRGFSYGLSMETSTDCWSGWQCHHQGGRRR